MQDSLHVLVTWHLNMTPTKVSNLEHQETGCCLKNTRPSANRASSSTKAPCTCEATHEDSDNASRCIIEAGTKAAWGQLQRQRMEREDIDRTTEKHCCRQPKPLSLGGTNFPPKALPMRPEPESTTRHEDSRSERKERDDSHNTTRTMLLATTTEKGP